VFFVPPKKDGLVFYAKILYNNLMKLIKQEKLNKEIVDKFDGFVAQIREADLCNKALINRIKLI